MLDTSTLNQSTSSRSESSGSILNKAKQYAVNAHGDQMYGEFPYRVHLEAVVAHLKDYGETAQVIGYLHDVVEDTDISIDDICNEFGQFVADCVADCVAIVTDEPGKDRKERKTATYAKMSKVMGDLELALVVKTADRLANLESCVACCHQKLSMYKSEHSVFTRSVYRSHLYKDLWDKIDAVLEV